MKTLFLRILTSISEFCFKSSFSFYAEKTNLDLLAGTDTLLGPNQSVPTRFLQNCYFSLPVLTRSSLSGQKSGQCHCKPNACSGTCSTCKDGFYNLQEQNYFGCQGEDPYRRWSGSPQNRCCVYTCVFVFQVASVTLAVRRVSPVGRGMAAVAAGPTQRDRSVTCEFT